MGEIKEDREATFLPSSSLQMLSEGLRAGGCLRLERHRHGAHGETRTGGHQAPRAERTSRLLTSRMSAVGMSMDSVPPWYRYCIIICIGKRPRVNTR